jgi:hypothetical protein
MDPLQIGAGALGACSLYFLFLVATKGLPAAWAWLKSKWTAGGTELANLRAEFNQLSGGVVSAIEKRVTALEQALGAGKAQGGVAPAAAAPVSVTTAGPAAPSVSVTAPAPAAAAPAPAPAA